MLMRIRSMFLSYMNSYYCLLLLYKAMKLNTVVGGDFGKQIISPILVINQKCFNFWSKKSTIKIFHIQVLDYLLMTCRKFFFFWGWASPLTPGQVHSNGQTEDFNDFSLNFKNKYFPSGNRLFSFQIWIQHPKNYLVSNV